jgi:pyruvate dehydrogenase E2 component (dihydrolipoamide acetyltransferase)
MSPRPPITRAFFAALGAALFTAGCGQSSPAHAPDEPAAPAAPAAIADAPAPVASAAPSAAPAPLGPRVEIAEVKGGDAGQTKAAYLPTAEPISRCSSGGAIRVRIKSDDKSTSMKIEDSTSLDAAMRRCVLEALSTVDLDDVVSRSSPSAKSPGYSSLVTVAW